MSWDEADRADEVQINCFASKIHFLLELEDICIYSLYFTWLHVHALNY